jgi:hypothetical protein
MSSLYNEEITYKGKTHVILNQPLKPLLEIMGDKKPVFVSTNSWCWRGYVGSWEVKENSLFLIELKGHTTNLVEITLDFLFPNQKRVFAGWFTGEITIRHGRCKPMGYGLKVHEKYLYLTFKDGILIGEKEEINERFDTDDPLGVKGRID